jgi:hypothetical protein
MLLIVDECPEVAAAVPDIAGILRAFLRRPVPYTMTH